MSRHALNLIHEAFPDLTSREVIQLADNPEIQCAATELTLKNVLTYKIILGLSGYGIYGLTEIFDFIDDDWASQINPFYRAKMPPNYGVPSLTWCDACLNGHDYEEAVKGLKPWENFILPFKMKTLFCAARHAASIKKDIFAPPPARNAYNKEALIKRKPALDLFLAQMGKLFKTGFVWGEFFNFPEMKDLDSLSKTYEFQKGKEPQTIMDVCLTNNLPQTAVQLIDEVYESEKTPQAVTALLKGSITQNLFKENKRFDFKKRPKNTVTEVMDHLENLLPRDIYLSKVEGRYVYQPFNSRDFHLE